MGHPQALGSGPLQLAHVCLCVHEALGSLSEWVFIRSQSIIRLAGIEDPGRRIETQSYGIDELAKSFDAAQIRLDSESIHVTIS